MPLQTTRMSCIRHILYRILLSALILLSLLWLTLADWPVANAEDLSARMDGQHAPAGMTMQTGASARLRSNAR